LPAWRARSDRFRLSRASGGVGEPSIVSLPFGGRGAGRRRGWRGISGDSTITRRGGLLSLDEVPPGRRARVVRIEAGTRALRRLVEMGLTPGTVVEVVADYGGPILVRVRGTVLAIGRGMARKVLVELV